MKDQWNKMRMALGLIMALGIILPSLARAGFNLAGYDLKVVKSGQGLENAAVSFQTNSVWIDGALEKPYNFTTNFILPQANEIFFARLYMNIWGGTNENTCQIDTMVNGAALEVVNIGGTSDSNPTYDAGRTCVYGSGYGTWQVAYSGVAELLSLDGTDNIVDVTISDPSGQFDGRTIDVSLVAVYRDPNVNHALDYYLAEADGYMRRSPGTPGSPAERILNIDSIDTNDVINAIYTAHYTHGTAGQLDRIYFNGIQLNGDDVALGVMGKYGPDVLSFDITDLLLADSTVRYSVDETIVGSPSEFSLRAKIGLLEIARPYCREPIPGDVNNDCRVDFIDFAIMALHWLDCNLEPQSACWK
ncbi:MAG: DUF3344 domain-containing protein [Planctomycetota bacterium]